MPRSATQCDFDVSRFTYRLAGGAIASNQASIALREFFGDVMLTRVAPRVGGPDADLRMSLAVSHLIGTAILRHAIRFPTLETADVDTLAALVGDTIQPYFTPPR